MGNSVLTAIHCGRAVARFGGVVARYNLDNFAYPYTGYRTTTKKQVVGEGIKTVISLALAATR